jgi:dihydroneopterin aldolase
MSHDIVFVRELRIETVIGCYEWERRVRQFVVLDLEMRADARKAAAGDRVEDALDYEKVTTRVAEFVSASEFKLVETLAERVAELVMREFSVRRLRLTVSKPGAIRNARTVGVTIERNADDA